MATRSSYNSLNIITNYVFEVTKTIYKYVYHVCIIAYNYNEEFDVK